MKNHPYKEEALALFLSGKKPREIAEILPVKEETIYKWKRNEKWANLYEKNQANEALVFITALLEKEKLNDPANAKLINSHLKVIHQALINPARLLEARIAGALIDINKALQENLI